MTWSRTSLHIPRTTSRWVTYLSNLVRTARASGSTTALFGSGLVRLWSGEFSNRLDRVPKRKHNQLNPVLHFAAEQVLSSYVLQ